MQTPSPHRPSPHKFQTDTERTQTSICGGARISITPKDVDCHSKTEGGKTLPFPTRINCDCVHPVNCTHLNSQRSPVHFCADNITTTEMNDTETQHRENIENTETFCPTKHTANRPSVIPNIYTIVTATVTIYIYIYSLTECAYTNW